MSRQEVIRVIDDYDGQPIENEEPIVMEFSVEGEQYQLDLRPSNVTKFQKDMTKWTDKAQKVGGRRKRRAKAVAPTKAAKSAELAEIRNWARDNGYEVSDKGRVPAEIREAFEAAVG
ncbi:nucloid associated Lsr2-like [Gordonia phage Rabbitrun]|uniref:Lsr2-like DNA bridging protein n=1 Tax=Gordonia phage Rabbitrun TaxID=2762280 RepID=A0A7G8LIL2_9CAUD|nr:nucloid associated Lsr2-like [Gordonia phage Rabbitrun]QNJ57084.1 Lsr2-like DNA bridging protein [Gordonia phage Rabbitrun]